MDMGASSCTTAGCSTQVWYHLPRGGIV